ISVLSFDESERNNFQYVVIEVDENCPVSRDQVIEALHAENVLARKYFWPGCHAMKPYRELYPHAGLLLSNTELVANRAVVLPTGTMVDVPMVELVVTVIRALVTGQGQYE